MHAIGIRKHWIFDMDGTLTLAQHDFAAIRSQLGLPANAPILEALAELPQKRAKNLRQKLELIEAALAAEARSAPGVDQLLERLILNGKILGIVTRNSFDNALATLRASGLAGFFKTQNIICRDAAAPKPAPDGIHLLLKQWRAPVEDSVMVGDYLFDLLAGRQAGTATVYVDVTKKYQYAVHADLCISGFHELLTWFSASRPENDQPENPHKLGKSDNAKLE